VAESKNTASMKEVIGDLADDIEAQLEVMHVGMRAGDQTVINTASGMIEAHIREMRVVADSVNDPPSPPLPPIVGPDQPPSNT
jgi:hypothetical protein